MAPKVCPLCPLCKKAPDSVHHRVWWWEESAAERDKWASPHLVSAARAAGPASAYFNRAIGAHPGQTYPKPCVDTEIAWIFEQGSALSNYGKDAEEGSTLRLVALEQFIKKVKKF